jgi:hypothetical protein
MSRSKSVPPEPRHTPEEATRWFNQWHVYRSIVDADWMAHREIFGAIRSWVLLCHPGPFALLDLGCGDAEPRELARDATGFHRLLAFTTGSAS